MQKAIEALSEAERRELARWLEDRERASRRPARAASLRGAVLWSVLTLLLFFVAEGAIFRRGWYNNYLQPDSTAGEVEYHLFWLRHTVPSGLREVLVVGDSRIGEGFSARAGAAAAGNGIRFRNFGMAGTTARIWYYTIRDADPQRNRFSAIVLALPQYSDQDGGVVDQDRLIDLNYLAGRLRLIDCPEFALSFRLAALRGKAFAGCLFPGMTLRHDVMEFLADRPQRLKAAKDWRNNGAGYVDGYGGKPDEVVGISADWTKRTVHFPPGLKDWQTGSIRATVMPEPAPQTGLITEYRKEWLGRILDLYKNSATRIVFMELPRAPLPVPEPPTPARFIQSITRRQGVTVLPADTFRDLERPDFFADGLHLNHIGRPIFSERLGQKVAAILEGR